MGKGNPWSSFSDLRILHLTDLNRLVSLIGKRSDLCHNAGSVGEEDFLGVVKVVWFDGEEPAWAGTTWGAGIDFCALKLTSVALSYHVSCFTQC